MTNVQRYEQLIETFTLNGKFEPIKSITDTKQLDETFAAFPKNLLEKLWSTLMDTLRVIFENKYFLEDAESLSKEQQTIVSVYVLLKHQAEQQMLFLRQITSVLHSYLKHNNSTPSKELYEILKELHGKKLKIKNKDLLFELGKTTLGIILQENIATLCEKVYLEFPEDENSHELVPQMLPLLLSNSLQKSAKKGDVKRVYNLKDGLNLLDLEEENVIQELLLRCVISPFYLNLPEGKKFIQFIFTLNTTLIKLVHSTIISQIASAKHSILETYGDFYFKAWKNSTGKILLSIEYDCIQDLMYHSIHSRDLELFKNIRVILDCFYLNKKQNGVDEMLLRLYEPILFRSLNVANEHVRRNAASILIDAFPFRNPDHNKEETENLMQKQYKLIEEFLKDDCPKVRVVGVEGISKILGIYWEIIPTENTYQFLKLLILEMANDSSSPSVRQSVFKGLTFLLDNHLAQPTLKNLLKKLSNSIHDASRIVKVSFLDLLLKVKSIRSIKYYEVVDVDEILMRLAVDSDQKVIDRICQLIMNSFLPFEKSVSIQISRLLDFIERNSIAAKKFYQHACKIAPLASVSKLIHVINKYLKRVIESKKLRRQSNSISSTDSSSDSMVTVEKKKRKLNSKKSNDESNEPSKNEEEEEETNSTSNEKYYKAAQNIPLIENLVEIQFLLFESTLNEIRKVEEPELLESTIEHFNGEFLNEIVTNFKTPKISCFVWGIAKNLPRESIEIISQNSLSRLELMCEEGVLKNDYKFILDCVVHWNLGSKLMDMIEKYLKRNSPSPTKNNTTKSKKQRIEKTKVITPENSIIALHFVNYLLEDEGSRNFILRNEKISDILTDLMEEVGDYLEKDKYEDEVFYLYPKFIIHLVYFKEKKRAHGQDLKIFESTPIEIVEILDFYLSTVLPSLCNAGLNGQLKKYQAEKSSKRNRNELGEETAPPQKTSFGLNIAKTILIFVSEMISLGIIKSSQKDGITEKITELLMGFLQNELKNILPNLFVNLLRVVFQWVYSGNEIGSMMFTLNDIFYFFCEDLKEGEMKYIHELILECMNNDHSKDSLTREMMKRYMNEEVEEDKSFSELIIQICTKNKEFLNQVLNELFYEYDASPKKPRTIQFIAMMLNDYQNEFKDSMKEINAQLSRFDDDENILQLKSSIQVL